MKKICKRCGKEVSKKQKAVLLKTFQGEKTLEEFYFHFQCYLDWLNQSIEDKAKKIYSESMKIVGERFAPMVNNILGIKD